MNRPIHTGDRSTLERERGSDSVALLEAEQRENAKFLRFAEMYTSLQGEGAHSGLPCFFIRTGGCDLRCSWCDTPDALSGGSWVSLDDILQAVPAHVSLVQLTGGEPLLQRDRIIALAGVLSVAPFNKKLLLETGGHLSLADLPRNIHIVMDVKLPASGEAHHDFAANFEFLKPTDEIKFVIADRDDYEAAARWLRDYDLERRFQILFSPVWNHMPLADLADWIIADGLNVRLQTQLHKHVWGGEASGV
ncbi:MAG: 7-carboxy-7-deazaguanine synthase QueE [bacterium]|nr:7-carboxy-7-deazaguanine synthase QueE [bacterium]